MSVTTGGVITLAWLVLLSVSPASEPQEKTGNPTGADVAVEAVPSAKQPADTTTDVHALEPLKITASVFKIPRTRLESLKLDLYFKLKLDFGFPSIGGDFVITPGRARQGVKKVSPTTRMIDRSELAVIPASSLRNKLVSASAYSASTPINNASPGLSNQAMGLRGAHALVLLDGVPLNDPYGGWIPWVALPENGLARIELVAGGGATAWGNGTAGGVAQFFTLPPKGKMVLETFDPNDGGPPETKQVIEAMTQLATVIGGLGSLGAELVTSRPAGNGVLQILGRGFRSGGFSPVETEHRGPIDQRTWSRQRRLEVRWRQSLGKDRELVATVRTHDEAGGNGTFYQQGSSKGTFASLALAGSRTLGFAWNAVAYAQSGASTNRFSAVSPDRSQETPVIDRFAVPTEAFGASWTGIWRHPGDSRTNAGVDLRHVRGETRENVGFTRGAFTRERAAGGTHSTTGAFVLHDRAITKTLRATTGARIDAWNEMDGHQREIDPVTRAVLIDQRHGTHAGTDFSPSLGFVWQPSKPWRWRAHGQHAFRRPTLGERYQMSGTYNAVTAANPDLRTEHSTSAEIAAEYSIYRGSTSPVLTLEARAFHHDLRDAVGPVTVTRGSGEFALLDTLPATYRGVKRINLDRARSQGVELVTTWRPNPSFTLEADLRLSDATILHSAVAPGLKGNRMAETPSSTALLSATWKTSKDVSTTLRVCSTGRRFIDGENTLPLGAVVVVDFGINYMMNQNTELYLAAENLTDSRIETGRDLNGLVYVGSPRIVFTGLRLTW